MALQPTNNLPKNTGNKKPQKTNYKVIVITIAVVIAVIVMMIIANLNSSSSSNPYEQTSDPVTEEAPLFSQTEPVVTEPPAEAVDITDTGVQISEITVADISVFHKAQDKFIFDTSMQYSGVSTVAEDNVVYLGDNFSYTPSKSCTIHYDGNRLDIAHTSGTVLSIMRSSCDDEIALEDLDAELNKHLAEGKASSIQMQSVFYGTSVIGRLAKGSVDIDGTKYTAILAYICRDREFFTILGLAEEGSEDFLELLMNNVWLNNNKLSIG